MPDLVFDSSFECGNVGRVERLSKYEYEIRIRPDMHNDRHRLWFYFKVTDAERGQRVLFSIPNFSKGKSSYRDGMSPLVKSKTRPTWNRIPPFQVLYYRAPKKKSYVLSFFFTFDDPNDEYYFSYCYPYSYTDVQRLLVRKEVSRLPFFHRELICRTPRHRRIDLVTITSDPRGSGVAVQTGQPKRVVVLSARIHPGESPASFMMQGAIDFLTSGDPRAALLRDALVFKVVPMLNPDGVAMGNYRCNAHGYDLNRFWGLTCDPRLHPEVHAAKALLLDEHTKGTLDFFIDMHSHSAASGAFFYANAVEVPLPGGASAVPPPSAAAAAAAAVTASAAPLLGASYVHPNHPCHPNRALRAGALPDEALDRAATLERWEHVARFPTLLSKMSPCFSLSQTRFDCDPSKEGTGRRELGQALGPRVHCYTLEASFYAFSKQTMTPTGCQPILTPFTPERYMELGRDVVLTLLDYYAIAPPATGFSATAGTKHTRARY